MYLPSIYSSTQLAVQRRGSKMPNSVLIGDKDRATWASTLPSSLRAKLPILGKEGAARRSRVAG